MAINSGIIPPHASAALKEEYERQYTKQTGPEKNAALHKLQAQSASIQATSAKGNTLLNPITNITNPGLNSREKLIQLSQKVIAKPNTPQK